VKEFTYAKAGVNISKIKKAHKTIADLLKETFSSRDRKFGRVLTEIGHYAGLIDIGNNKALALHVDGVGTKVLIAQALNRFETIGIDCVAMCVNDIICLGAEPVALVDYLAVEKLNDEMINEISKGLVEGAKQAEVAIVGGETAVMKDVITGIKGKGFDLAAMCVGVVEKDKIITGEKMRVNDVVIGLESSGLHSNGYTLARKVLFSKYKVHDFVEELGKRIGEELLIPTKIYVKPVLEIIKNCEVHGLANITGGAFSKLMRIGEKAGVGFLLDNMPELPEIFKLIQKEGKISDREMYRTFNCGIGFCVVAPESECDKVIDICKKYEIKARIIGKVVKEKDVKIKTSSGIISVLI
jgi:phosphoribosylformylglycinamidine cyclo-ligase